MRQLQLASSSTKGPSARQRAGNLLCGIREFERRHLDFLETFLDRDLVCAIAVRQSAGAPLTMKQAVLLGLGSVPTVQRRLRRLRRLGVVRQDRSRADRRVIELRLTPRALVALAQFGQSVRSSAAG